MRTIDFLEIRDWHQFEELVFAYFNSYCGKPGINISSVESKLSGIGPDAGKDVIVEYNLSDGIIGFKRKWIVQCKFHNDNISPSDINSINIPSLIHSYSADGYLLICKKNPTSGLTEFLSRLSSECRYKYKYLVWSGEQFITNLYSADNSVHRQFFPLYFEYSQKIEKEKNI